MVKTGPLFKKASKTKISSKYWVVLKNDVLSWFESTAVCLSLFVSPLVDRQDPYFPKGSVSLHYVSSCDAIDSKRFKLRTSERNYSFSAETEASRDEWLKAIEKVIFKTQHEGEIVKVGRPSS